MNTQKLEQVPIDKLVPYARNARTHSKEQIAQLRASLREFGFVSPAVIDADYNILVGHGRITAAREEGYETVPCVFAENLTEAQKRAYILADNQLALNAGWDEEMLSVELSDLQDQSFDLSLLGFDAGELDKLLGTGSEKDIADDDFDLTAALEKASFVEPGDIWTVGKHRVMCGDATSPEDVEKLMDGRKANLVLTDPPYGVSFKASDGLTIQNDSLKGEEFYKFLLAAFKNMADHLEKGGAAYCFHADTEGLTFRKAFINAGFHLAGVCIWVKNSLVLGRSDYQWQHEPVLYGFLQNGKPFELIDWQERIIRDLFGVLKPNGYRQFNTAYIEIPKKMGKSELAAAVALLLCCGDGEERAEVYGCAADRQQATIVFDVAADMVRMCPALNRRVKILASQKRIIYEPTR